MRLVTPLGLALALALLPPVVQAAKPIPPGGHKATILSTSSVGGETKSCGCKKKDLGGLAGRASLIAQERTENSELLLVDAGDFGTDKNPGLWVRTEFQFETMGKLGYDVVTPGTNELLEGQTRLAAVFAKAPKIQVVSANITDKAGKLLWSPYTVITKGGVRYGITGVTDGAFYDFNLKRGFQLKDEFGFLPMKESLTKVVPELRKQSDVVVVLLYSGAAEVQAMAKEISGIDVVVVGRNPGFTFVPDQVGSTFVVRAGKQGQYLGTLDLYLDEKGKVVDWLGESLPIGDTLTPDPALKAVVEEFNKKVEPQEKRTDDKALGTP